jgi:hypothetical protein
MGVLLFKGGVGVGMLKWQTSVPSPPLSRGERAGSGGIQAMCIHELWQRSWYNKCLCSEI